MCALEVRAARIVFIWQPSVRPTMLCPAPPCPTPTTQSTSSSSSTCSTPRPPCWFPASSSCTPRPSCCPASPSPWPSASCGSSSFPTHMSTGTTGEAEVEGEGAEGQGSGRRVVVVVDVASSVLRARQPGRRWVAGWAGLPSRISGCNRGAAGLESAGPPADEPAPPLLQGGAAARRGAPRRARRRRASARGCSRAASLPRECHGLQPGLLSGGAHAVLPASVPPQVGPASPTGACSRERRFDWMRYTWMGHTGSSENLLCSGCTGLACPWLVRWGVDQPDPPPASKPNPLAPPPCCHHYRPSHPQQALPGALDGQAADHADWRAGADAVCD